MAFRPRFMVSRLVAATRILATAANQQGLQYARRCGLREATLLLRFARKRRAVAFNRTVVFGWPEPLLPFSELYANQSREKPSLQIARPFALCVQKKDVTVTSDNTPQAGGPVRAGSLCQRKVRDSQG
jgi:hypothetical protein